MPARVRTELKQLRGTLRGDRTKPPEAPAGVPRPSRALPDDVRREWRRLVRELEALGMASAVDGLALELAAQAIAETWRLDEYLHEHGQTCSVVTKALQDPTTCPTCGQAQPPAAQEAPREPA